MPGNRREHGANTLLHMATLAPDRIEAMVAASAAMYFPEQARAIMAQVPVENQPEKEWEAMRKRHKLGDDQIVALWEWQRGMKDSHDDMNFTPPLLARIKAPTLIVYGALVEHALTAANDLATEEVTEGGAENQRPPLPLG